MQMKKGRRRQTEAALMPETDWPWGVWEVNQEGSEEVRKAKWEPKAVKKEKKEEIGQGHLALLKSSERMGGKFFHNELRNNVFPVAFKLINMYYSYGLYGVWCMETQLFLVYSIKECSVEYSQASSRTDLMTKGREFLNCLEV